MESASSGMVAGINIANKILGKEEIIFPKETATGALCHYISDETIVNFQPMNVTFGIITPSDKRFRKKKEKNAYISARAIEKFKEIEL